MTSKFHVDHDNSFPNRKIWIFFQKLIPPFYKSDFFSISPRYNVPSVPLILPPCSPNGSSWIYRWRHHGDFRISTHELRYISFKPQFRVGPVCIGEIGSRIRIPDEKIPPTNDEHNLNHINFLFRTLVIGFCTLLFFPLNPLTRIKKQGCIRG